jgi:hypothetical protein
MIGKQVFQESVDNRPEGIMRTEKEKMLAGELYDPLDQQLSDERRRASLLLRR